MGPYPPRFQSSLIPARPYGISSARSMGLAAGVSNTTTRTASNPAGIQIAARAIGADDTRRSRHSPTTSAVVPIAPVSNAVLDPESHIPARLIANTMTAAAGACGASARMPRNPIGAARAAHSPRSEEHTSELQSHSDLVLRPLL